MGAGDIEGYVRYPHSGDNGLWLLTIARPAGCTSPVTVSTSQTVPRNGTGRRARGSRQLRLQQGPGGLITALAGLVGTGVARDAFGPWRLDARTPDQRGSAAPAG